MTTDGAGSRRTELSDGHVLLRPWEPEDAEFLAAARADPAIRRYNGHHDRHGYPAPVPGVAEARAAIQEFEQAMDSFASTRAPAGVAFVIEAVDSGRPVGCCGVDSWSVEDVAQIGYWLVPTGRGHGYATRAVALLTGRLFGLGAARVFLTVVADNTASAEVARRAGFSFEGTMRSHSVWHGQRRDVLWFGALSSEWAPPPDHRRRDGQSG